MDKNNYNSLVNQLISIEDKFMEIEPLIKTINIWIKENDYELIPIMNILNSKIKDFADILRKQT